MYNLSNHIVRINPVPEHFSISWMLGSRCNYDCMYCPREFHDMTSRPHDLDTMQQAWRNMHQASVGSGLKYKISFTGGEVTANKNFLPLVQWMRENYQDIDKIQITTNGSASLNYYLKLSQVVDSISFSTHSEFMNEAEFFTKVLAINAVMIRPQKSLHVNVMDEHWNRDRQSMYVEWLRKNNISHSTNEINYSSGVRDVVLQRGTKNFETIIDQS